MQHSFYLLIPLTHWVLIFGSFETPIKSLVESIMCVQQQAQQKPIKRKQLTLNKGKGKDKVKNKETKTKRKTKRQRQRQRETGNMAKINH